MLRENTREGGGQKRRGSAGVEGAACGMGAAPESILGATAMGRRVVVVCKDAQGDEALGGHEELRLEREAPQRRHYETLAHLVTGAREVGEKTRKGAARLLLLARRLVLQVDEDLLLGQVRGGKILERAQQGEAFRCSLG